MSAPDLTAVKAMLAYALQDAAPDAFAGYWSSVSDDDTSADHYDVRGSVNADKLATTVAAWFATRNGLLAGEAEYLDDDGQWKRLPRLHKFTGEANHFMPELGRFVRVRVAQNGGER